MPFDPACIDVEHFLETLDVRNLTKATTAEMRFSCPLPSHGGEDARPSCYMNIHSAKFYCQGCKGKGNAISFTSEVLGISPLEAIRILKQAYSPSGIDPDARDMVGEVKKILNAPDTRIVQPLLDEGILNNYDVDWLEADAARQRGEGFGPTDYMLSRGFTVETLEIWRFGYDEFTGRITLPVRNESGDLIGFKARATDGRHPKYLVLGDEQGKQGRFGFPRYYPSKVVFGAYRYSSGVPMLVVCEGELNAIAVTQKTGLAAVAINGSNFTEHHAKVIRRIADEVVLFLDDDKAGQDAVWGWEDSKGDLHPGLVDRLRNHMQISIVGPHAEDAAELDGEQIHDLVNNAKSALLLALGM